MTNQRVHQAGFTIIELLVATVIFSFILLLCTYGIIKVGNDFYKGITEARTQENARDTIDRITQDIQFSGGTVTDQIPGNGTSRGFCVGDHRYSFLLDTQLVDSASPGLNQAQHVMVVDSPPSPCANNSALNVATLPKDLPSTQEELISLNVRIVPYLMTAAGSLPDYRNLIWNQTGQTGVYNVGFKLIYGGNDTLNASHDACGGGSGIQFCASSTLLSTVQQRFKAN